MKKIFYFLLLLLNSFVFGQNYPTIHPLEDGKYLFQNLLLESHVSSFDTGSNNCQISMGETYNYFSFKANFDMVFAFDLIASNSNFRFLIWKVPKGRLPQVIFDRGTTINPQRTVEGSTNIKGLKSGVSNLCEYGYNSLVTGYAKAFEGNDLLKEGETIVIAVYGGSNTDVFDIKVNVAEERQINTFNNLCNGQSYTYQQIYDAVKNDSSLSNIKLYSDTSFNNEINNGATFGTNTTVYAQVKGATGNLQYIYTIPIQFIAEHVFNFKSSFAIEYACSTIYTIPNQSILLSQLFDTVDSNYTISSISINGVAYSFGNTVTLRTGEETVIKVKVHFGGTCPIDSQEVSIPLKQGTPILYDNNISDVTCSSSYSINYDTLFSKLGIDKNQYNLVVTLGGNLISDGNSIAINVGTPLVYQVKIVSKSSGCESNLVNFTVTRTSLANIVNASISGICLDDFSQTNVDEAINTIMRGVSNAYQLRYYQADGTTEVAFTELSNYVKTNKNGLIIVKALASDNSNTICDTTVDLTFDLGQSTFIKVDNIPNFNSTCSEVNSGYTFTKTAIETYLKSKLGNNIAAFSGISDVALSDNQSTTISFKVKINNENCWSDEMQLKLQVITKPNVSDATRTLQADCNNLITINQSVLNDLFGSASTTNYDYEIQHNNSTALTFDSSGEAKISVLFKNKIDNTCFVEKIITVTKKQNLDVDATSLNAYNQSHEIVFCADDETGAKNQIQTLLDYIKTRYATLESLSTVDEIFAKIGLGQGNISITFEDPNYCGQVDIKFYYQQNELPSITVPEKGYVCTGELYVLNFSSQSNYNDYNYIVEKIDGTRVTGIDKYDLEIGTYKVTIENKSTGCSVVKTLVVENSPLPTIEKIVINQKNIIVTAKGSGVLQYALYDYNGNVIINWQRSNTLIIPANLTNSNFVVKVSLDNCGISEESDIIYLDLPNVITPNGDGKNDIWKPMTKSGQANDLTHSYKLIIFDRYGKQILSKEGVNVIEWDGTQNGMILPDDSYWYLLESSKKTGIIQVQYSGSILLKRKI